jgi:hypothetical protein
MGLTNALFMNEMLASFDWDTSGALSWLPASGHRRGTTDNNE